MSKVKKTYGEQIYFIDKNGKNLDVFEPPLLKQKVESHIKQVKVGGKKILQLDMPKMGKDFRKRAGE